ncbi:ATP8B1 protein [Salpingoeca rosetta]|uniref:Phospholipid-transporting ATPase n=1 Tax=Salpingoeca rosetta (strain ATCC 50818 / BSB-021) TaxID=946362 RepID=F2U8Q2_SALR5|nr:ATP8B1 protein [Salpingoeca rosetta]EGD72760.1 ATP8B1 protein [Salpingoeca rosetta]|eukprot:XP_004994583.1 ATP8B1 protein [Salpingoeca rosetta]
MADLVEERRLLWANDPEKNEERCKHFRADYGNRIKTAKYTLLTFLPVNLFEQFMRVANAYFLLQLILQLIPQISSLSPITTALPLVFVLGVTAVKDGNDDYKRHKSDATINNRAIDVLRNSKWVESQWQDVHVGEIIRLRKDDFVPADLVVLSTTEADHDCYIETADLDGETNLKKRYASEPTREFSSAQQLSAMTCEVSCNPPNNRLDDFDGSISVNGEKPLPISNNNVILRGCRLRNTNEIRGVVVYTGNDTKLMRNSGRVRFKRTHIDKQLNNLVIQIFFVLFAMCVTLAILSGYWERTQGERFMEYLNRQSDNPNQIAFLQFFSYLIVLSNLVPISLYVSVELIRLAQSQLIGLDVKMYFEETDTPAVARTTTLNEELGQIDYVFSDKTGTLTQNVMRFLQCSIAGNIYGKPAVVGQPYTGFIDDRLHRALDSRDANVVEFFEHLAVCQTVRPEKTDDGELDYQAQSPDEKALVEASRDVGIKFTRRTGETIELDFFGERRTYGLLNIIEFTSTRKRMTVVVRDPDGGITAYSKGADTIMQPLLSQASQERDWPAVDAHLHEFAKDGLRTLVLAKRRLSSEWYEDWAKRYYDADVCETDDRKDKLAAVAQELETELELVGASAIEDKLQDGVPETIANLMRAGIKVWVLTGDKLETAINIGFSCRLLKSEMEPLFIIDGKKFEDVEQQLRAAKDDMAASGREHRPFALVITGQSLSFPLPPTMKERKEEVVRNEDGTTTLKWTPERLQMQRDLEALFLDVCSQCHAVLCCRVSPLQKAQVVKLVKSRRKAITLAIGDGANDVSMIKAAHIGVGISGLEGRQAVLASDYALAQFAYLQRLLLVHGRWSYLRMSVFLRWFFYKNFAYAWAQFFFAFFCGFSALTIYDGVFISTYNVVFTSLPILVIGTLEQDVSARDSISFPLLYEAGPRNFYFSRLSFYWSLLRGIFHSVVIFFVAYGAITLGGQVDSIGQEAGDYSFLSTTISVCLVWVVNLELGLMSRYWTWLNFVTLIIGPISWFLLFSVLYTWDDWIFYFQSPFFGVFLHSMEANKFWAVFFLTIGVTGVLTMVDFLARTYFYPTPVDIVREKNRHFGKEMVYNKAV